MAKATQTVLENRLGSIKRGAYWFGIIGRLSIIFGFAILIFAGIGYYLDGLIAAQKGLAEVANNNAALEQFGNGLEAILYGWLFLLGRDAFEAVEALIKEMQEIV